MSTTPIDKKESMEAEWERAVGRAVRALRYGSVEIVVHDGRVVQVETRERVRFVDENRRQPDSRGREAFSSVPGRPDDRGRGVG